MISFSLLFVTDTSLALNLFPKEFCMFGCYSIQYSCMWEVYETLDNSLVSMHLAGKDKVLSRILLRIKNVNLPP